MTVTLCQCGEPFYQTDDGLMCKRGHDDAAGQVQTTGKSDLGRTSDVDEVTENPPLAEGNGLTALPGVAPVGVAENSVPEQVKAVLPIGAFRTKDHRYYWNGEGPFPSVTTVLNDVLAKHALIKWKSQEVARAIFRDSKGFFGDGWSNGEDAAVKWALARADEQRDQAARLGSSIHLLADLQARQAPEAAEKAVEGFQVSDEEIPYLEAWKGFLAFLEAQGARIVSSEHMVWSSVGYAGTYDLILEWDGQMWLVDIKTSKGIYPDYALQLAAYGHAEQIILEGSPVGFPMPKIDRYGVLHLRPDAYPGTGYRLWEYPLDDEDYYRFISVLDLYLWRKEDKYRKSNLLPVTGTL